MDVSALLSAVIGGIFTLVGAFGAIFKPVLDAYEHQQQVATRE